MELGPEWTALGPWGLFLACFLAATVLPFSSEAVLAAMAVGPWSGVLLWSVATAGNWLGGMSTYGLGRLGDPRAVSRWIRIDQRRAEAWHHRIRDWGPWAALACWVPVIGDPIALALGLGRARFWLTALLMLMGKAARYAVIIALLR